MENRDSFTTRTGQMKTHRLIQFLCTAALLAASALSVSARERGIDSLFSAHSGEKGYTSVTYGSRMLKMMQDGASAQLRRLLENIDVIRIISTEEFPAELEKQAQETAADDCYELVSEVGSGDVSTAFFFKEECGDKSSFMMITSDSRSTAVLDIYGIFDIKDISSLSALTAE